ncbi:helix-turn-helix domain-containing protein [Flavobacterium oreochromis]|uniref:helix-turn-helix domain-containing protein n=1 Tax=Flavobacterium oreochromis TaxID=2906078 RepID=UPI000CDB448E|nr:helicase [Flavobacterium columnare]
MENISDIACFALQFVNQTHKSIFLTGKAGTGKTTLLKEIIATSHKNTAVVAPTGIAALNAGGVTIHSLFQLPFSAFIPDYISDHLQNESIRFESKTSLGKLFKMSTSKKQVLRNLELLIVDEVSMLRPDVLDAMDFILQKVRKSDQAFGGVQILFIGDLWQLPPVIKQEEWFFLQKYYPGSYFFYAKVLQDVPPLYLELDKIYRQSDNLFIDILNNLRNNTITAADVCTLNQYVQPNFDIKKDQGTIVITTHNAKADTINKEALEALVTDSVLYNPEIVGNFPEKMYPLDSVLELKIGAQIMFIKNDNTIEKRYYNGKIGIIKSLSKEEVLVEFPEENKVIEVDLYTWENIHYEVNTNTQEVEEKVEGTFSQYPLKLAWAITVHKSQGLTFKKAVLDVASVFAPGQAYVALSRLESLNGLTLLKPIQLQGIPSDQAIINYAQHKANSTILPTTLDLETKNYLLLEIIKAFDCQNITQLWRNFSFSFKNELPNSPKLKYKAWAEKVLENLSELSGTSKKFISQLQKIGSQPTIDIPFLNERTQAGYQYFFEQYDNRYSELLLKIVEIKQLKKTKTLVDELLILEEEFLKTILGLKKMRLLLKNMQKGIPLSKKSMQSDEVLYYKINKVAQLSEQFKQITGLIDTDYTPNLNRTGKTKKKTNNETKQNTIEITLNLWKQNKSIHEIAKERKLTNQTIYNHFSKLILEDQIQLSDLLSSEKIEELNNAFKEYQNESLGSLKEQFGDQFTWDELRLYIASIKKNKDHLTMS